MRRTATILACVLAFGALAAVAVRVPRVRRAAVEAERAALEERLAPLRRGEDERLARLASSYAELEDALAELSASNTDREPPFGVLWQLHPERLGEVEQALAVRACSLERLEALPAWFWSQPSRPLQLSPPGGSTASLLHVRSAVHALTARAWLEARRPQGGEVAGRTLARALALLRIVDDGSLVSMLVRASSEAIVSATAHRIAAEGLVDSATLSHALEAELISALEQDRWRTAIVSGVQIVVAYLDEYLVLEPGSASWWWERAEGMDRLAHVLRIYRRLLDGDPRRVLATTAASETHELDFLKQWRSALRSDRDRIDCLEELLAL